MPSLTIRHITTYRYRHPVTFGEHRMMLRPRNSRDQKVIEASLGITPEPSSLRSEQDAFGNHVAIARFNDSSTELRFESIVSLEHSPADAADLHLEETAATFPVDYGAAEMSDVADCIQRRHPDPEDEVGRWARQFLPADGPVGTLQLLVRGSATAVAATSPC